MLIRPQPKLDSTGLNRALFKLSRNANLRSDASSFRPSDIALSNLRFRVNYNESGDSSLYVLVTQKNKSGRVVAISSNYSAQPLTKARSISRIMKNGYPGTLAHMVQRKEAITARRENFI